MGRRTPPTLTQEMGGRDKEGRILAMTLGVSGADRCMTELCVLNTDKIFFPLFFGQQGNLGPYYRWPDSFIGRLLEI